MKTDELICFNNRTFNGRRLSIQGWGEYLISSTELQDELMDSDYNYVSEEARILDEQIFFFIEPSQFKLSDSKLAESILKSL